VLADDCIGFSPHFPWRKLIEAFQPLHVDVIVVRHSTLYESCESLRILHQSMIDDMGLLHATFGLKVAQQFCEPDTMSPTYNCSLSQQWSHIANSASNADVVFLMPWQTYRNGFDAEGSTANLLHPLVNSLFSFSDDFSICSGGMRALSVSLADCTCHDGLEKHIGVREGHFFLNPSPHLTVNDVSLLPFDAFRSALQNITANPK
jgi:hypothetical protein